MGNHSRASVGTNPGFALILPSFDCTSTQLKPKRSVVRNLQVKQKTVEGNYPPRLPIIGVCCPLDYLR
jgi:hypothetical protein